MRIIAALVMMASCLECVGNAQDSPGVHKLRQSLDHLRELGADDRLESLSPADRSMLTTAVLAEIRPPRGSNESISDDDLRSQIAQMGNQAYRSERRWRAGDCSSGIGRLLQSDWQLRFLGVHEDLPMG